MQRKWKYATVYSNSILCNMLVGENYTEIGIEALIKESKRLYTDNRDVSFELIMKFLLTYKFGKCLILLHLSHVFHFIILEAMAQFIHLCLLLGRFGYLEHF